MGWNSPFPTTSPPTCVTKLKGERGSENISILSDIIYLCSVDQNPNKAPNKLSASWVRRPNPED